MTERGRADGDDAIGYGDSPESCVVEERRLPDRQDSVSQRDRQIVA